MRLKVRPPEQFHRLHRKAGFTLLEVLAGMLLIVFLTGGVYSIADATLRLGASMSRSRVSEARLMNFTCLWRSCMENLPADTRLTVDGGEKSSNGARLLLENCGTPFAWNRHALGAAAVEFTVARASGKNSSLMLRHLKRTERAGSGGDYYTIAELPLLEDVTHCSWSFYDTATNRWSERWDDPARLPLFMRMKWSLADDPLDHEEIFWLSGSEMKPAAQNTPQPQTATPPPATP